MTCSLYIISCNSIILNGQSINFICLLNHVYCLLISIRGYSSLGGRYLGYHVRGRRDIQIDVIYQHRNHQVEIWECLGFVLENQRAVKYKIMSVTGAASGMQQGVGRKERNGQNKDGNLCGPRNALPGGLYSPFPGTSRIQVQFYAHLFHHNRKKVLSLGEYALEDYSLHSRT